MKNAHLRTGTLQFTKVMQDTTIDVRLHMDRLIAEHESDTKSARCHLLSLVGNDQEVGAIAAAISDEARFYASAPNITRLMITLGKDATVFRNSISVPGRRRPLRHLVALSDEFCKTCAGGDLSARRTILFGGDPEFVLHRLGVRFGLPILPEWSDWLTNELQRRQAIEPLIGVGCRPVVVKGTKKRFLGWIGHGLKRGTIQIPANREHRPWRLPDSIKTDFEDSSAGAALNL